MSPLTVSRGLPLAILSLTLVAVPALLLAPQGLPRLRTLESELSTVRNENAALEAQVEVLRRDVRDLRDDPAAVERIARTELGLVRKSEVVYQFDTPRRH